MKSHPFYYLLFAFLLFFICGASLVGWQGLQSSFIDWYALSGIVATSGVIFLGLTLGILMFTSKNKEDLYYGKRIK